MGRNANEAGQEPEDGDLAGLLAMRQGLIHGVLRGAVESLRRSGGRAAVGRWSCQVSWAGRVVRRICVSL